MDGYIEQYVGEAGVPSPARLGLDSACSKKLIYDSLTPTSVYGVCMSEEGGGGCAGGGGGRMLCVWHKPNHYRFILRIRVQM